MELTTDADEEVASWITAGTPPIYFGFGWTGVESVADTVAMISAACAQLGERALVCTGGSDFSHVPHFDHVKVVGLVNFAATFPACRAVVHHGGTGTTAAGLRAGVPTLILSTDLFQTLWGARVKRLKVGTARRLSTTTQKSLVADLRQILAPQYVTRAREIATRMTTAAESAAAAADLVENFARPQGRRLIGEAGRRDDRRRSSLTDRFGVGCLDLRRAGQNSPRMHDMIEPCRRLPHTLAAINGCGLLPIAHSCQPTR